MFLSQVVPKILEITPRIAPDTLGECQQLVQMRRSLERVVKEALSLAMSKKFTITVSGVASLRMPPLFLKICSWKQTRAKSICLNSDIVHRGDDRVLLSVKGDSSHVTLFEVHQGLYCSWVVFRRMVKLMPCCPCKQMASTSPTVLLFGLCFSGNHTGLLDPSDSITISTISLVIGTWVRCLTPGLQSHHIEIRPMSWLSLYVTDS